MKKFLALCLALLMVMSLASAAFAADEKVTLTFVEVMTSPERTQIIQSFIDKYEEMNPNITVELVSPPYESSETKAASMLAAGQDVDVVEIRDITVAGWIQNGFLMNLDEYLAGWEGGKEEILDAALQAGGSMGDGSYFLPQFLYVKGLLTRTDILAEHGITEMPKTLDEFYEVCKQISDPAAGQYALALRGIGQPLRNQESLLICEVPNVSEDNIYFTNDGEFTFATPEGRKALETYKKIFDECCPPDSIGWGYNEQINGFVSGITPFFINDPDSIMSLKGALNDDQYTCIPMPIGSESGVRYLDYGFAGLAVAANTQHPEEAVDFFKYMLSAEVNTAICELYGALPVNKYAYENSDMFNTSIYEEWASEMADAQTAYTRFPVEEPKYAEYANSVHLAAYQSYLLGEISIDDYINTVKDFWTE